MKRTLERKILYFMCIKIQFWRSKSADIVRKDKAGLKYLCYDQIIGCHNCVHQWLTRETGIRTFLLEKDIYSPGLSIEWESHVGSNNCEWSVEVRFNTEIWCQAFWWHAKSEM